MTPKLRLYNTLKRKIEDFVPIEEGKVSLYVCGMTTYDHVHVGHARAMVVFDSLARYLRHRGYEVEFVRNFTDMDDKIIARAQANGEAPATLAERFVQATREDLDALGLLRPNQEPRVSESIEAIVAMITTLVEKGHAYAAAGSVWFSVATDPSYGKLSGQDPSELRNPENFEGKREPGDFALWKGAKPGEPSWPSPWGPGRPGWHIECSAMCLDTLGQTIDIHGGGLDLVFPHHENEVAQSECANAAPFARTWMHNGMLTMGGGQKMGKSLGNVINVRDALKEMPAEALRIYYLQNHYRSPLPWSDQALPDSLAKLARLYEARESAEEFKGEGNPDVLARELGDAAVELLQLGRSFPDRFHAALDNDFSTAQALGLLFELTRAINHFAGQKKAKKRGAPVVRPALDAFALVAESIGLLQMNSQEFQEEVKAKRLASLGLDAPTIEAKLEERESARTAKEWDRADALRKELEGQGIQVMDSPGGVEWRVRL